jgi:putative spermidine/putrescine transport system substrate-binding protein
VRRLLRHAATLTLALAAIGLAPALAQQPEQPQRRSIVLSAYTLNQDLFLKHVYLPFKQRCQCELLLETGNAADRLAKLEARRALPTVDLIQLTDFAALEASAKGLLQPLDYAKIPNAQQIHDFARDPLRNGQAIGYTVYAVGLAARSDLTATRNISSWKDLARPELRAHVALPQITTNQGIFTLFMSQRANGSTANDYTAALSRLAELRADGARLYTQTAQVATLFAEDKTWLAPVGRFAWTNLQNTGKPLKWIVPKEGHAGALNVFAIPKGSPNADLALQLIDFWLSKDVQAALANDLVDSPVNPQAPVHPGKAALLTFGPQQVKSLVFLPPQTAMRERTGWIEAWNRLTVGR